MKLLKIYAAFLKHGCVHSCKEFMVLILKHSQCVREVDMSTTVNDKVTGDLSVN